MSIHAVILLLLFLLLRKLRGLGAEKRRPRHRLEELAYSLLDNAPDMPPDQCLE